MFNFFKGAIDADFAKNPTKIVEDVLQESIQKEASNFHPVKINDLERIHRSKPETQIAFLLLVLDKVKETLDAHLHEQNLIPKDRKSFPIIAAYTYLFNSTIASIKEISEKDLMAVLQKSYKTLAGFDTGYSYPFSIPRQVIVELVKKIIGKEDASSSLKEALKLFLLLPNPSNWYYEEEKKLATAIEEFIVGKVKYKLSESDQVGKRINAFMDSLTLEEKKNWVELIEFFKYSKLTKPSNSWIKNARKLVEPIDSTVLINEMIKVLDAVILDADEVFKIKRKRELIHEVNSNFMRCLMWLGGLLNKEEVNKRIDSLALVSFKKIPQIGAIDVKLGNSCIYALSLPENGEGIASLTKLRMKIKYPSVQKYIEKVIADLAAQKGKTADEIEEMAVPDFGLTKHFQIHQTFEDYTLRIQIQDISKSEMIWINSEGKEQKSVPQKIKDSFAKEIKEAKKLTKDIADILTAQKDRIEQLYFRPRSWKFSTWKEHYLDHPLMSLLSRKLIWYFKNHDKGAEGIYFKGKIINSNYQELDWIHDDTEVQLWHPIGFAPDQILKWREWMVENEIQQPFKQAYREIYILTDAEIRTSTYSNRFAAHILRQHQFTALCKTRGWHYTLQGQWDSHNVPYKELPHWGLRAEFWAEANIDEANPLGIFTYVTTDQVRFYNKDGQLELINVPALIFSEVMREVDLFVSVTSIGNNPEWQDSGNQQLNNYFYSYSVGDLSESAKTRKEALQRIISKMKIASRCSFTEKHLVVKGDLKTYKIHLGSGNIFMEPNDEYLCIVRDSKASSEKVFLPFEGDTLLSLILSKAMLLAEDKKITDKTILSQIHR